MVEPKCFAFAGRFHRIGCWPNSGLRQRDYQPVNRPGPQSCTLSVSVEIAAGCDDFCRAFLLPLPTTQEWGEDRGEGRPLLSPALSSNRWRRGSVWLRLRRAVDYESFLAGPNPYQPGAFAHCQAWMCRGVLHRCVRADVTPRAGFPSHPFGYWRGARAARADRGPERPTTPASLHWTFSFCHSLSDATSPTPSCGFCKASIQSKALRTTK